MENQKMGIRNVNKKKMKNMKKDTKRSTRRSQRNGFNKIPKDILVEVLARVAGSSFTDFFNARVSCKQLWDPSLEEGYIFKHINISRFPVTPWVSHPEAITSFLDRCSQCGNPESLFREGMIRLFCPTNPDIELQNLKRAASKGHIVAMYVLGIIYTLYFDGFKEEGLNMLANLRHKPDVIRECRKTVFDIVNSKWRDNYVFGIGPNNEQTVQNSDCKACKLLIINPSPPSTVNPWTWTSWEIEKDSEYMCNQCFWSREGTMFCHLIETGRFRPYH